MAVKLLMTWDIKPEHEQEYFEFVIREFIPGIQRLGAELTDAWATVYHGRGFVSQCQSFPPVVVFP